MRRLKKWMRSLLVGLLTALVGLLLVLTPLGAEFERLVGLPWLFDLRGPIAPPAEVAVVAIDDSTGPDIGLPKLPREWPRSIHGTLTERLVEQEVAAIVFDLDFQRPKEPEHDLAFAEAVAASDRVILYERMEGRKRPIPGTGKTIWVEEAIAPIPELVEAAKARGPFPLPKLGAAVYQFWAFKSSVREAPTTSAIAVQIKALDFYDRWLDLLRKGGAPSVDSLPQRREDIGRTEAVWDLMTTQRRDFRTAPGLAERVLALMETGQSLLSPEEQRFARGLVGLYRGTEDRFLNFYGPPGSIPTIPFASVINREAGSLAGKVVFVGFSDLYNPGQPDRFYTVFTGKDGIDLAGVEIMATAFANLLTDSALTPSGPLATALAIASFGFFIGFVAFWLPAAVAVPLVLLAAIGYAVGAQLLFNQQNLWVPLATPMLVQLPLALLVGLMGQYLLSRLRERQVSRTIRYYLPENIAERLTEGGLSPDQINRVVYGTCVASDMAGFTSISETKAPKDLAAFMNAYFDAVAQSLKQYAVDVTEFHADTIMCAWTSNEPEAGVRKQASLAAIELKEAILRFSASYGDLGLKPRVGLQDGQFYLGHTGGGGHFAYSILGDTANTAARLESLNKHLATQVLASASVVEGLEGELLLRPVGSFQLVGKGSPLSVVEVMASRTRATSEEFDRCARFAEALDTFGSGRYAVAERQFDAILKRFSDDGPSRFYQQLCWTYSQSGAPESEPAVVRMASK